MVKIEEIYVAIGKVSILVLLFKSKLLQSTSSSMLANINDRKYETKHTEQMNKTTPNTFYETFCKIGIDPEEVPWITPKSK